MTAGAECGSAVKRMVKYDAAVSVLMKSVQAKIPDDLHRRMLALAKEGWFPSQEHVVRLALRKFLDSHNPKVVERFIREDVEWGLRGAK